MSLLSVLNPAIEESSRPISVEEEIDRTQCVVVATRAITTLLLQTLLRPKPGQPIASELMFKPRDANRDFHETRLDTKP